MLWKKWEKVYNQFRWCDPTLPKFIKHFFLNNFFILVETLFIFSSCVWLSSQLALSIDRSIRFPVVRFHSSSTNNTHWFAQLFVKIVSINYSVHLIFSLTLMNTIYYYYYYYFFYIYCNLINYCQHLAGALVQWCTFHFRLLDYFFLFLLFWCMNSAMMSELVFLFLLSSFFWLNSFANIRWRLVWHILSCFMIINIWN